MGITWRGTWTCAVIVGGSVLTLALASGEGCGGGDDTATPPGTGGAAVGGHGGSGATSAGGGGAAGSGGGPECTGNETQPCYDGPDGTEGVGTCHAGTSTCAQDQWGPCDGQQIPLVEDCNTVGDEDCNGVPCSEHLWSKEVGGTQGDLGQAVAIDAAGNVVVGGWFTGTADLGCGPLQSAGTGNGFVALYEAGTGNCLWSTPVACPSVSVVTGLATDLDGNIVVTGTFAGQATILGTTLTGTGTVDGFLLKVDPSGGLLWGTNLTTAIGATGSKTPRGIAIDAAGDIVVAGSNSGHWACSMYCDPVPVGWAAFVGKHSGADGHLIWRRNFDSAGDQQAWAVATASDGSILVGGSFAQTLDLGSVVLTAPTGMYGFLAKLTGDTAATVWARSFGDAPTATMNQEISAVAMAAGGDVVVAGQSGGGVAFDTGDVLSSAGGTDVFLARYTSTGDLVWRGLYGDAANQMGTALAVDSADNVILVGGNRGTVDFGGGGLITAGGDDAFLAKFSGTGTLLWDRLFGADGEEETLATAVDALDQIAIVGRAASSVDFGGGPLPYAGSSDAFVAMFYP